MLPSLFPLFLSMDASNYIHTHTSHIRTLYSPINTPHTHTRTLHTPHTTHHTHHTYTLFAHKRCLNDSNRFYGLVNTLAMKRAVVKMS